MRGVGMTQGMGSRMFGYFAFGQGITQIPIEKRFRLGGNSSLRGFNRNCIGGLPGGVPEDCSDAVTSQTPAREE